jgi:hypothetical protein
MPSVPHLRCILVAHAVCATALAAQGSAGNDDPRAVAALPQWESRLEAVAADVPSAVAGLGINVRAGWYVRAGALLAAGVAVPDNGAQRGLMRLDATVRFHLDPFAERRRGLYAGAGITAAHHGAGAGAQPPQLMFLAGIEGQIQRGRVWALELGLGGGVRLGLARRSARKDNYR